MKVIVSGGGTGGHIYPAITIVRAIRERVPEAEFLYVGTKHGLESDIVHNRHLTDHLTAVQIGVKQRIEQRHYNEEHQNTYIR